MARRVTIVGGLFLAAGLLLGWLGQGFFGLGGAGTGEGSGTGTVDASRVRVQAFQTSEPAAAPKKNTATPVSDITTADDSAAAAEGVVNVIIDGETYLLRQPAGGKPAAIELGALVDKIRGTEGNSAGVRVHISRRGTSIPVAEERLEQALLKADVPRTAVVWADETAP